jgi:hypothetical protein
MASRRVKASPVDPNRAARHIKTDPAVGPDLRPTRGQRGPVRV